MQKMHHTKVSHTRTYTRTYIIMYAYNLIIIALIIIAERVNYLRARTCVREGAPE